MDNKKTGSYYTPLHVVEFMVRFLAAQEQNFQCTLEPSAGDGRFLPALLSQKNCCVDAVELFENKVRDMSSRINSSNVRYVVADFLDYISVCEHQYQLIIGNPPYVNLKNMESSTIEKGRALFAAEGISTSVMQNLWSAFLVGAVKLLRAGGTIFFVLPMEFLQVQYAEKLRLYLEKKFNQIKIFTFETDIFPNTEQNACLVYLSNRENVQPYIEYYRYHSPEDCAPFDVSRIEINKPLKKWSNAVLSDEDIQLLKDCATGCLKINQLGPCAPGIVTGGNKYFIVNQAFVTENQAQNCVLPILQKSSFVKQNTIFFNDALFQTLQNQNVPIYLLNLAHCDDIPQGVKSYLERVGEEKTDNVKLKERHKCKHRTPWYGVPIVNYGDVFFFKRSDKLPHLYINEKKIHTTDAGYHIRLAEAYDAANVVFCFYNSLTLALCEFNGRYYGGGVLELTPSEFKSLAIPYTTVGQEDVKTLDRMFQDQRSISDIVSYVNERTLARWLHAETIERLNIIRRTLMQRRISD